MPWCRPRSAWTRLSPVTSNSPTQTSAGSSSPDSESTRSREASQALKGPSMTSHTTISPQEAADRLAIRELVDAYAHCADRRDAGGQMDLFTQDTRFLVFYDLTSAEPSQELHGRESLAPVFDDLNQYVATMHFNGQSTISLEEDRATGESYCLAHHLKVTEDGQRTLMVASIRYHDQFVKQDGQWLFAERRLMVNWIDTRPSTA